MSPALLLLLGVLFIALSGYALALAAGIVGRSSKRVRDRLAKVAPVTTTSDSSPTMQTNGALAGGLRFLASATSVNKIERDIMLAGRPAGWTIRRILVLKPALSVGALLILISLVSSNPSAINWVVGIVSVVAGYFAPDIIIGKRAEARQLLIRQELPDILDQVTISIEAGLGFEAAFARIGERRSGPMADEIVRAVQDMRLGMSRRDAYQGLADRTDVDDVRSFVKAVIQAEQYGVSMASVVRTQAQEMRFKRRSRAEGAALKVPVKILFPLLLCILPVLFVVVLAPAIISMGETLG